MSCSGEEASLADEQADLLDEVLADTLASNNGVGLLMVARFSDGSVYYGAAGVASLSTNAPMEMTSSWRIGSVSKTFLGTAVLLLVKDGLVGLDDSIEEHLPGVVPGGESITVRMLLEHTSGLFDYTWSEEAFIEPYLDELTRSWTAEELIDIAAAAGPVAPPGEVGSYCNTNFVILGLLVERLSELPVEQFIAERITEPLGMTQTFLPTNAELPEPYTDGYFDFDADGTFTVDEQTTAQDPSAMWTAGAIVSTPDDMLIWLDEILQGSLIGEELQAERTAFNVTIDGQPNGAFGLGLVSMDGGVGHTGAVPGYQTLIMRYDDVEFVVYTNGYLLGGTGNNVANEAYSAAVEALFDVQVSI